MHKFLLLDAARVEDNIRIARELNSSNVSIYKGTIDEELNDIAPFLFTYNDDSEFATWYFKNGWGNSWGLIIESEYQIEETLNHFQKILIVKTEDDQEIYFRFYDPRVLRIFLPTCDSNQLKELFGPVECFICEDEDPAFGLVFTFEHNSLKTNRISKEELFNPTSQKNAGRKFFV